MKKKIIVYDFDKTIYDGETGVNFSTFYLKLIFDIQLSYQQIY